MSLHELPDLLQGSQEWHDQRRGMVTASVVGNLITVGAPDPLSVGCPACQATADNPCLNVARKEPSPIKTIHAARTAVAAERPPTYTAATGETARNLIHILVAERITGHTEPTYLSDDMLRGMNDEPIARDIYSGHYAEARETGFMVRDDWGFQIGYSPDGLVGDNGLIEIKSRRQKKQLQTILSNEVPAENMAQLQCGLLVSGREWIDYVSYCGGMPLYVKRIYPAIGWFIAIRDAVAAFEENAIEMVAAYRTATQGLPATERVAELEMSL